MSTTRPINVRTGETFFRGSIATPPHRSRCHSCTPDWRRITAYTPILRVQAIGTTRPSVPLTSLLLFLAAPGGRLGSPGILLNPSAPLQVGCCARAQWMECTVLTDGA